MSQTQTPLLSSRLVRYKDLKPCLNAFVDTRTPGSDQKENFTIIGPGVSENPQQHVHIAESHGFNIGGARQPPGCLNSQHSHDTAEVFVVHSGSWRFMFGAQADEGSVELSAGDTISIPTQMFRGFENIGDDTGFLFAVLGGDNPGNVTWSPSVFELARQYGLVLLEGGRLIDRTLGEEVPEGASVQQPPDAEQLAALQTPSAERLRECVVRTEQLQPHTDSALLSFAQGSVQECPIITPQATPDGFNAGPISGWWPHGFNLRRVTLAPGASLQSHTRLEQEVLFVQQGQLTVRNTISGETLEVGPGDTLTLPIQMPREWHNPADEPVEIYVVRGSDTPQRPVSCAVAANSDFEIRTATG